MCRYFLHRWTYLSVERESTPQHVHGVASCKSKAIYAQRPNYGTDVSLQVERFSDHLSFMRQ